FRTTAARQVIAELARRGDMLIGAGTVLKPDDAKAAKDAGAAFGVAPGLNEAVVKAAQAVGLPFFPGVMTPSDVERAIGLGLSVLKFFPAETAGGVGMLKSLHGPYG